MPTTRQETPEVGRDDVLASGARNEEQQVASGRASETPLVVLGAVALAITAVVGVVVAIAFLVFWLI
jgi:hypothetical protein